ncbi:MAG: hypothetical protein ACQEW8_12125 [Actinomycetota bacterium]
MIGAFTGATSSCAPQQEGFAPPAFALTSAEVVHPLGESYPINLIFLAHADDPIWTDLTGIELPSDASVGPGEFEVIRGEGPGGLFLGNVSFHVTTPEEGITFESVGLVYEESTEPVRTDVGPWSLRVAPPEDFATVESGAEVLAMSSCTRAELPVPPAASSIDAVATGSDHASFENAILKPETDSIAVELSCTTDMDFFIISPTLDYADHRGDSWSTRIAPIAIGFHDIDDEDLQRIKDR